jgi:hypothetical protein
VDKPTTSGRRDEPGAEPDQRRTILGGAALLCAVAGSVLFLAMIGAIEWVSWQERPLPGQRRRALAPPLGQALLFGGGSFVGGVVSVVGMGLAAWGLRRRPRALALWALVLGIVTLALTVGWYLVRSAEVRLASSDCAARRAVAIVPRGAGRLHHAPPQRRGRAARGRHPDGVPVPDDLPQGRRPQAPAHRHQGCGCRRNR